MSYRTAQRKPKPPSVATRQVQKARVTADTSAGEIEALHARVRKDIAQHVSASAEQETVLRHNANNVLQLESQNEVVSQVAYSCRAVDRLLLELTQHAKSQEISEASKEAQAFDARHEKEPDLEIQGLRTLASDDTSLETASVGDYSADPPSGPTYTESSIIESRDGVAEGNRKVLESLDIIQNDILANSHYWWASPNVLRRLKTHTVRMSYHARKGKKWGNQARSHLFVGTAILRRTTAEATAELEELQKQTVQLKQRKERLLSYRAELEKDTMESRRAVEQLSKGHEDHDAAFSDLTAKYLAALDVAEGRAPAPDAEPSSAEEGGPTEGELRSASDSTEGDPTKASRSGVVPMLPSNLGGPAAPNPAAPNVDADPTRLQPLAAEAVLLLRALEHHRPELAADCRAMTAWYRQLQARCEREAAAGALAKQAEVSRLAASASLSIEGAGPPRLPSTRTLAALASPRVASPKGGLGLSGSRSSQ